MKKISRAILVGFLSLCSACVSQIPTSSEIRVATFNVSIEATNYLSRSEIAAEPSKAKVVVEHLRSGTHPQLKNIAEIIQRTRPDILLLNEFDYIEDSRNGIELFINNYLASSQGQQAAIEYPYFFVAPVNTGVATPFDLDNNGKRDLIGADAFGFGYYPGQFGMAILSRFPIDTQAVRTLQNFLWKDMPDALKTTKEDGSAWYTDEAWSAVRLSSKSHWDVPIMIGQTRLHILASHPTPPTFDGPENRNGKRNHDEIRLIKDYLAGEDYIKDDAGTLGGLAQNTRFVVVGDLNSSPVEGDSIRSSIKSLLEHDLVDSGCTPISVGGQAARRDNIYAASHTAAWGLRVDYALPSRFGVETLGCGLFWPEKSNELSRLTAQRGASSDHRLVWVDLRLQ